VKRTYYIVEHVDKREEKYWMAHKRGFNSIFNAYNVMNSISETISFHSPEESERFLRSVLDPVTPKVVRVLKI
jgi:hypothetical protein